PRQARGGHQRGDGPRGGAGLAPMGPGSRVCPEPEGRVEPDLRGGCGDARGDPARDPHADEPRPHVLARRAPRVPGPGVELGRHLRRPAGEDAVRRRATSLVAVVLTLVSAAMAGAAVKPGLEGAQELFRQSRWEEARGHLRSQWGSLPEKDRAAATFLIGRSYVREAEFYRGVRRLGDE